MRDLIRSVVSDECLLDAEAVHSYAVHGRAPEAVVAPRDAQEAAAVLKLASENRIPVECAGAGSRLRAGQMPRQLGIVMTSARLRGIAEYEPADLVIAVGAGTSFPQLHEAVAPHNQFLALDPSGLPRSTIGAAVATAAAGPLRYAHGTPRDQVLGLEVVTGDGRILHFGGRVVKNVAGYDLVRLMVGSRGTLGFVTRVNVRLKPQPEIDQTMALTASSFGAVAELTDAVLAASLEPAALEILSGSLAQEVSGDGPWTLLIRLHGNAEAARDAAQQIARIANGAGVRALESAAWRTLAESEAGATLNLRFANLPSLLRDTTAHALETARLAHLDDVRLAIHAGDGIVRLLADQVGQGGETALLEQRAMIEKNGGTLIVERAAPGVSMAAFGVPDALGLMTEIKKVFDPAGILGAGRFVV
ncbi:MAG TPA: FAD-binding oxidoreductase [Longimicrobiales bacterium]